MLSKVLPEQLCLTASLFANYKPHNALLNAFTRTPWKKILDSHCSYYSITAFI